MVAAVHCEQERLERARGDAEVMKRDLTEKLWDAEQRARCAHGIRTKCASMSCDVILDYCNFSYQVF